MRHLLGITKLDKEKNQCIRQKTGAQNIVKEMKQNQKKWLQHVKRMDTNRLPNQALQYKPKGRRNIGRPRKRIKEQETRLTLQEHDDDDDDDNNFSGLPECYDTVQSGIWIPAFRSNILPLSSGEPRSMKRFLHTHWYRST